MNNKMKDFIKYIDWSIVFLILATSLLISVLIFIIIWAESYHPPQPSEETIRKAKICWTNSNDFWRNDVEFIDGKYYYKGKEVEIK
nr:MAG TPA: hypothetical protein [Caudoviricetes sp.]